jgi:hypothetical protein
MARKPAAVEDIEKPAEEASALELRTAVEAFNAGTKDRTSITDVDRRHIAEIDDLTGAYLEGARVAFSDGSIQELRPAAVTSIANLVQEWTMSLQANMKVSMTDGNSIEVPAVESAFVREALYRKGQELVGAINVAIGLGYARIEKKREQESELRRRVRYWMSKKLIRTLTLALLVATDDETVATSTITSNLLEALRHGQLFHSLRDKRSGETLDVSTDSDGAPNVLPIYAGKHREWLPIAREVCNQAERGEA